MIQPLRTVVCQSWRERLPRHWIGRCLRSVQDWARDVGWEYRFLDDELLALAPEWYVDKAGGRGPVVADLARLLWARQLLEKDWERVVWMDADVLVFDPERLRLEVDHEYAFGRELWVQRNAAGRWRVHRNVHNAVAVFVRGNSMLDFYIHACEALLRRVEGGFPNQFVGPKLLSALHSLLGFTLIDEVGALSPAVLQAIADEGGEALEVFRRHTRTLRAANLCCSLAVELQFRPELHGRVVDRLLATRGAILAPFGVGH